MPCTRGEKAHVAAAQRVTSSTALLPCPLVPCTHLSLSRLNHGQPGVQAHPEMVQGTTELHHQVTDTLLPQAHPVFHNARAIQFSS